MADFYTLNTDGYLFTEIAGEWDLLTADFGDGFEVAALVGSPEGTRTWSMKIDVLPATTKQAPGISHSLDPVFLLTQGGEYALTEGGEQVILESNPAARAEYLWKFFRVSKASGNQPFWVELEDPDDSTRKMYLASFVDNRLTYQQLCAKVYSTGLQLRQRRVSGVVSPVAVAA
jgi:hypothetical protein